MSELIDKQAVLNVIRENSFIGFQETEALLDAVKGMPMAEDAKEISYADCSDAMLKMWMDKVLTDGEYNRIMEKLNEKEKQNEQTNRC